MARPATPDIKITEALKPTAEPVQHTFQQVAEPARSPLHEVARALSGFSSELAAWGAKEEARKAEEDKVLGEAAFHQNNQVGYEEGVRQGLIPPNASRHYVESYKRAQGLAAGLQLDAQFSAEFERWDGRTSDDPAAFNQWFRGVANNAIRTDDPHVLRGLTPQLREMQNRYHDRWRNAVAQETRFASTAAFSAASSAAIDTAHREGLAAATGVSIPQLGADLMALRENAFRSGMTRQEADKLMTDSIVDAAVKHQRPEYLGLLDVPSASGPRLSDTAIGRNAKMQAEATLTRLYNAQMTQQRAIDERKDREEHQAAIAAITRGLITNPMAEVDEALLRRIERRDGDFRIKLTQMRETFLKGAVAEDPSRISEITAAILRGELDQAGIIDAVARGDVRKPETMAQMMAHAKAWQDYRDRGGAGILETDGFRSIERTINNLGKAQGQDPLAPSPLLSEGGRAANITARMAAMKFAQDHPNATPLQREQFMHQLHEQIARSLDAQARFNPTPELRDSGVLPPSQPKTPPPPPGQQPQSGAQPAQGSSAAPPQQQPQGAQTREQETQLREARANHLGENPDRLLHMQMQRHQSRVVARAPQAPPAAPAPDPSNPSRSHAVDVPGFGRFEFYGASADTVRAVQNQLQELMPGVGPIRAPAPQIAAAPGGAMPQGQAFITLPNGAGRVAVPPQITRDQLEQYRPALQRLFPGAQITFPGSQAPNAPRRPTGGLTPDGRPIPQRMSYAPEGDNAPQQGPTPPGEGADRTAAGSTRVEIPPMDEADYARIRQGVNVARQGETWGNPHDADFMTNHITTIKTPSGKPVQVNKVAARAFEGFLRDLEATGYEIKSIGGHSHRTKAGGGTSLSQHAYGNALDINPAANPFLTGARGRGAPVTDMPKDVSRLAAKWGLSWGGDWTNSKDAMHFEFSGIETAALRRSTQVAGR